MNKISNQTETLSFCEKKNLRLDLTSKFQYDISRLNLTHKGMK